MFKNKAAGICLGSQGLSVVEFAKGKIKNYVYNPYPQDITSPAGALASKDSIFRVFLDNEVEIIAFLQKSIRDSRIDAEGNEIVVCVPTRDLIVRFFEIPPIPRRDISATVGFEIKKYIPFKTDEITYDYQIRSGQKIIEVLFTGIKNEDLDKYNSVITQSKINLSAIEPSQFSLIRLLKVKKVISDKESVVIVELGRQEGAISIIDCGLPCFSRDIKISSGSESVEVEDTEAVFFRIINEVRVSIDYFRRQFLKKAIDRIIVLSKQESDKLINTFNKELSIPVVYKDPDEIVGIKDEYSLDIAKALGASLRIVKPSSLMINLSKKEKSVSQAAASSYQVVVSNIFAEISDIPKVLIIRSLILFLFVVIGVFALGYYRIKPLNEELNSISKEAAARLTGELKEMNISALDSFKNSMSNKLSVYQKALRKDFYISEKLDVLPNLIYEGVWLEEINFERYKKSVSLKGMAYRQDIKDANIAPYNFVANLKNSALFSNKISTPIVKGLRTEERNNYVVIRFEVDITVID